jgi:D-3-phosphoglycerate dehydrogenase / 2-oxoglutarate reductase
MLNRQYEKCSFIIFWANKTTKGVILRSIILLNLIKLETIAIIDTGYESYKYEHELFNGASSRLIIFDGDPSDIAAKARFCKNVTGILVRGTKVDKTFMDQAPNLRAISRYGSGYENIDLEEATKRDIRVSNVQGYGNHSVSDHAISLMYACSRRLLQGVQTLREKFGKPPSTDLFEFHDKTLGIIGLGRIGSHLAVKAVTLFDKIVACDPYITDRKFRNYKVTKCSLPVLLEKSHVISIHCNLTTETHQMINSSSFSAMKNRPVVINTARGSIVDSGALVAALENNTVHSAGIDVFETEPPGKDQNILINHPQVIATGHYAWYSDTASGELQKRAADNLLAMLRGKMISDGLN